MQATEVLARAWLEADPDPQTQRQLKELIKDTDISDLFEGHLLFGTAGLRAELGPGPQRMNRVLVQLATQALVETLIEAGTPNPKIVVGYDGRKNSDIFAYDAVGVINEYGEALLIDAPSPTPVLARSVIAQNADGGIMVTASHNPRDDNGYKVYLEDGGQIVSPYDRLVEQKLSSLLKDFSTNQIKDYKNPQAEITKTALTDYVNCLATNLGDSSSSNIAKDLKIVYTPLHGVGKSTLEKVFKALGFPKPMVVDEQAEPDGGFPTVAYPNPEEEGVLDLALALATKTDADLLLANDPDADRLCVSLPDGNGGWQTLTGNELGVLLADYCINSANQKALVATTCVSSQLLGRMAKANGIAYEETLTGFKWISRADKEYSDANYIFGYEEALGYAVLPTYIRDKDGISAAVVFVNLFVQLRQEGKTPFDRLAEISEQCGLHLTAAASIRYEGTGQAKAAAAMARLRLQLPTQIGGVEVLEVVDYSASQKQRPTNMVSFYLKGDCRVVVRPSGTEPKLKVYVELVESDLSKKSEANKKLQSLTDAAAQLVATGS